MYNLLERGPFNCGETPVWFKDSNTVFWVDAASHKIYSRKNGSENLYCYNPDLPVSAIRKADNGNLWLLTKWGLYLWAADGSDTGTVLSGNDYLDSSDSVRFNDGIPLPAGGFIAGTFDEADLNNDRGSFYRINPNGEIELLDTGLHVTNGIAFDQDGTYYLSEMYKYRVLRYETADDGRILEKSVHIEFEPNDGKPDGLMCDSSGNLWVAHWLGWKLSCWSKEGKRLHEISTPVASPTCFCFADSAESSMIVTSATLELSENDFKKGPDAGSVFRLQL